MISFTPPPDQDPCRSLFLRDPQMLKAPAVNLDQGDLSRRHNDIDLAETLSTVTGKGIRRLHPDPEDPTKPGAMECADGARVDLKNPNGRLSKPLIGW